MMEENIAAIAQTLGNNLVSELAFQDPNAARSTLAGLKNIPAIEHAIIFDTAGRRFAGYHAVDARSMPTVERVYGTRFQNGYINLYEKIVYDQRYYGDIFLRASTRNLEKKNLESLLNTWAFILVFLAVVIALALRLQRHFSKSIIGLYESFKNVSQKKDYSLKLQKTSDDEIGVLYDGFNEMMEQINRHQAELKSHKENLETLVDERTRELKEKNFQLLKAKEEAEKANRLKSEFLANMSHEIRTPMNAILGFSDILLEDETDAEKKFYLTTVKKSGEDLLKLINNILDFSKIEANRLEITQEVFSPRELFNHIEAIFSVKASANGLYFRVTGLEDLPAYVRGDSYRLNQVLMNILTNAFKFTTSGGILIDCRYFKYKQVLESCVTDTGIGVPEEQQRVIFDPFRQADGSATRKYGGFGLGLSISQRLVTLMGGKLKLESKVNKGSIFTVSVPMSESLPPREQEDNQDKKDKEIIVRKTIVVIDPLPGEPLAWLENLPGQPYQVVRLAPGEDIDYIADQVCAQDADLVMINVSLPGTRAWDINDHLRKFIRTADIPVIPFYNQDNKENPDHSLLFPIADYIKKPVKEQDILARVHFSLRLLGYRRSVFIIEKEEELFHALSHYLSDRFFHCQGFQSGIEALQVIRSGTKPDVIIMDPDMPFMDGFDFLKMLKEKYHYPQFPVIFITARKITDEDIAKIITPLATPSIKSPGERCEDNDAGIFLGNYFKRRQFEGRERVQEWLEKTRGDEQVRLILLEAIISWPEKLLALEQAVQNENLERIRFLAHTLKGTSLNLQVMDIAERCAAIEAETRKGVFDIAKIYRFLIELKDIVRSIPPEYLRPKKRTASPASVVGTIQILVAEDDKINQKLIKAYFKRMGRRCDLAENGKVALEMMKKKRYDILFLDIQMPVMDGMQTIELLRKDNGLKDIYVIALTANAVKGDREKYIAAGCNDYLSKPVTFEALSRRIDDFIQQGVAPVPRHH